MASGNAQAKLIQIFLKKAQNVVAEDDRKAGYTWDEIREQLFPYFQGSDSATLVHLSAHLQKRNNALLYI